MIILQEFRGKLDTSLQVIQNIENADWQSDTSGQPIPNTVAQDVYLTDLSHLRYIQFHTPLCPKS